MHKLDYDADEPDLSLRPTPSQQRQAQAIKNVKPTEEVQIFKVTKDTKKQM